MAVWSVAAGSTGERGRARRWTADQAGADGDRVRRLAAGQVLPGACPARPGERLAEVQRVATGERRQLAAPRRAAHLRHRIDGAEVVDRLGLVALRGPDDQALVGQIVRG